MQRCLIIDSRICFPAAAALLVGGTLAAFDCNGNGVEDYEEVTRGVPDCNANHVPDECDIQPVNYGLARVEGVVGETSGTLGHILAMDLDADGALDLAGPGNFGMTFLWNDRVGRFQESIVPLRVALGFPAGADIEGDGDLDLAAAGASEVLALRNDYPRHFSTWARFSVGMSANAVLLADLDGMGAPELVATGQAKLTLFRRDVQGFQKWLDFILGSFPGLLVAADLNGDSNLDLVTGNAGDNVSVILNLGDGSFATPRNFAAAGPVSSLAAGDMDADGDLDIVTLDNEFEGENVSVLRNEGGARSFELSVFPCLGISAEHLALGDLDGDRDLDVALASSPLYVLFNHGSGILSPPRLLVETEGIPGGAVAIADLDQDESLDLILSNLYVPGVSVFRRTAARNSLDCDGDAVPDECQLVGNDCNLNGSPDHCDLALGASADCDSNRVPDECDVDCNRNGVPDDCDLASGASGDCNVNAIPDECDVRTDAALGAPAKIDEAGFYMAVDMTDLDVDGDLDIVTTAGRRGRLRTLRNQGKGEFAPAEEQEVAGEVDPSRLYLGDLEGDGDPDAFMVTSSAAAAFRNDGQGKFSLGPEAPYGGFLDAYIVADLDGDADLDIAMATLEGDVRLRFFDGGGSFLERGRFSTAPMLGFRQGDGDGDGDVDLIAALRAGGVQARLNDGGGRFDVSRVSPQAALSEPFRAADLDGDGSFDLAHVEGDFDSRLTVFMNRGDATFASGSLPLLEGRIRAFHLADVDADGDPDAVASAFTGEICDDRPELFFFQNDGAGAFTPSTAVGAPEADAPGLLAAGDADGDGKVDLVFTSTFVCECCDVDGNPPTDLFFARNETTLAASRDRNRNRVPDECEGPPFRRGDANGDGAVGVTDPIALLARLFQGGTPLACSAAADANDDARIDLADPIALLNWLFRGGSAPPPPRPTSPCGHDPDPPGSRGNLGCEAYAGC